MMHRLQVIPLPPRALGGQSSVPQIEGRITGPPFAPDLDYPYPPPPPPPFPVVPYYDGWELLEMTFEVTFYIVMFMVILWVLYVSITSPGGGFTYFGSPMGMGHHHHFYGGGGGGGLFAGRPHIHSGGHAGGFHSSGSHSHSHHGKREARNYWVDEPETLKLLSKILSPEDNS